MPISAQLDTGLPGQAAPLEGAEESKTAAFTATMRNAFITSQLIGPGYKAEQALAGGEIVPQADAQAKMKAQGYDGSVIPAEGITSGALDVMMQRQSDIKTNNSIIQRANLGTVGRFVASIVGGLPDPSNLALMAFAPELKIVGAGIATRAAVGTAEGAAYTGASIYGAQAVNHTLGDQDATSMDNLRSVLFGGAIGGGLHIGLGSAPPVVKGMTPEDLRNTIFHQVQQAEDATGKGTITVDTGGLTKFGISQKAHPDVDVANLTQEGAAKIIKSDYWDKIGGDHLSSDIAHTALDAAVNQGVGNANKWMLDSGGDPAKFNAYREAEYRRLAAENPAKYGQYLDGWLKRLENVKNEPILAPDQPPRVASVDQMGTNVDALPAETRAAAGEAAVNQFLRDGEVNVDQVINKSLEEQYGVRPTTDEDPTGGTGPRSALTLGDEHEAQVSSIETEAYKAAYDKRNPPYVGPERRAPRGGDTDLAKAVPQPNSALVSANDNARIKLVRDTAATPAPAASETEGPLTAAAKASTADAVAEAKAIFTSTRGPYVEDKALTPAQNAAAKAKHEAPLEAFKEHMTAMDEVAKDHETSAAAVEAAVRCAAQLGED